MQDRVSEVSEVPVEAVSVRPIGPIVPIVPTPPAFLEDAEDWSGDDGHVDLDRLLEADWDELAGMDLRHLFAPQERQTGESN